MKAKETSNANKAEIEQLMKKIIITEEIIEFEKTKTKELEKIIKEEKEKANALEKKLYDNEQSSRDINNNDKQEEVEELLKSIAEIRKNVEHDKERAYQLEMQLAENEEITRKLEEDKKNQLKDLFPVIMSRIVQNEKDKFDLITSQSNKNLEKQKEVNYLINQINEAKSKSQNYKECIKEYKEKISELEKLLNNSEIKSKEISDTKQKEIVDLIKRITEIKNYYEVEKEKTENLTKQLSELEEKLKSDANERQEEIERLIKKITIIEQIVEDEKAKNCDLEKQLAINEERTRELEMEKNNQIKSLIPIIFKKIVQNEKDKRNMIECQNIEREKSKKIELDKQKEIDILLQKIAIIEKIVEHERKKAGYLEKQLADNEEKYKDLISKLEMEKEKVELLEKKFIGKEKYMEEKMQLIEYPKGNSFEKIEKEPNKKENNISENPYKNLIPSAIEMIVNQVKNNTDDNKNQIIIKELSKQLQEEKRRADLLEKELNKKNEKQDNEKNAKKKIKKIIKKTITTNKKNYNNNLSFNGKSNVTVCKTTNDQESVKEKTKNSKSVNIEISPRNIEFVEQKIVPETKFFEISKIIGSPDDYNSYFEEMTEGNYEITDVLIQNDDEIEVNDNRTVNSKPIEKSYAIINENTNDDTEDCTIRIVNNDEEKKHVTFEKSEEEITDEINPNNYEYDNNNNSKIKYKPLRLIEKKSKSGIEISLGEINEKSDEMITEEYYEITEQKIQNSEDENNCEENIKEILPLKQELKQDNEDYVIYIEDIVEDPTLDNLLDKMEIETSKKDVTFEESLSEPSEEIIKIEDRKEQKPNIDIKEKKLQNSEPKVINKETRDVSFISPVDNSLFVESSRLNDILGESYIAPIESNNNEADLLYEGPSLLEFSINTPNIKAHKSLVNVLNAKSNMTSPKSNQKIGIINDPKTDMKKRIKKTIIIIKI